MRNLRAKVLVVTSFWLCGMSVADVRHPAVSAFRVFGFTDKIDGTFSSSFPPEGIYLSSAGNTVSYCPMLSCILKPSFDHQRATALFVATTTDDGHSQENTVGIETIIKTGFHEKYKTETNYRIGDNVVVGNSVYRVVQSGQTGRYPLLSNSRPSDDHLISDGTVKWIWINDAVTDAKTGMYTETIVRPGAGSAWDAAHNFQMQPGVNPSTDIGLEQDFGNDAATCVYGTICNALYVRIGGHYTSTHAVQIDSDEVGPVYASLFGLRLTNAYLAKLADIESDAGAAVGLGICSTGFAKCTHQTAGIYDGSTGAIAYQIAGDHSVASIVDGSSSPTTLDSAGKKSLAGIFEHSVTPNGLLLSGNYSKTQIRGKGWGVTPLGEMFSVGYKETLRTPKSSSAPCEAGQFVDDINYHYVCVENNKWKRVALSSF